MAATLPGQLEVAPSNASEDDEFSYYDIMVIGKTGMGKSTLANKLLGIDPDTKLPFEAPGVSAIKNPDDAGHANLYFENAEGSESVTKECKVLSNENTMTRVLDTPGLTNVDTAHTYGVARGNWECLRVILQKHRQHELRISRVVYFMPQRSAPERVEGTLQEEIKAMHGYCGEIIFNLMVIVVTNPKGGHYQETGFPEDDLRATKEVFLAAYQGITNTNLPKCPPIIYIPFMEDHQSIQNRIIEAEVISDAEMMQFSPQYPIDREIYKFTNDMAEKRVEEECKNCAVLVVREKVGETPVSVIDENGDEEAYESSKCHPFFVPKHSCTVRFLGGLGHVFTFGLSLCYRGSWPGFTNSEQKCKSCNRPPRTKGCCPINKPVEIEGESHTVNHVI